ncbi:hypothetical protein [Corynebacterium variabile]|uniref:hypothetical protein n=1 Tax=Corynebacterium variabile TaxID=1727 RepID=UPI00289A86B0|nr:hypothetical protein [Corynebacterium variabile]
MTTTPPSPHAADLLAGPRGRRLLLEVLLAAEETDSSSGPLGVALFTDVPPQTFAAMITTTDLPEITRDLLAAGLDQSVYSAMYWEAPDATDGLCAAPEIRTALEPVAEQVAASPLTDWWWSTPELDDQWTVQWSDPTDAPEPKSLTEWRAEELDTEEQAAHEYPVDPDQPVPFTGSWWSVPPDWFRGPKTTRTAPGATMPVGQLLTEDSPDNAFAVLPFTPPPDARVLEITGAKDWADLCREFPLEVTASRRHDWYRVTSRDGRWIIPDWAAVAGKWDAVHLTVAGYLNAATRSIPVPGNGAATDGQDAASLIANWGPDVTYWLR